MQKNRAYYGENPYLIFTYIIYSMKTRYLHQADLNWLIVPNEIYPFLRFICIHFSTLIGNHLLH